MELAKMLLTFKDGKTFGIEVDAVNASSMIINWFKGCREYVEIEGYDIDPKEVEKIEFFR